MMKHLAFEEEKSIIAAAEDFPCLTVTLPLAADFSRQRGLEHQLNSVKARVKKALAATYPSPQSEQILHRFGELAHNLHPPGDRKGMLIFVSPHFAKLLFLHSEVNPRIVINHNFEIRDLTGEQLSAGESLLLLLSAENAILYHRKYDEFTVLDLGVPSHIAAYKNDAPEKVANFSDPGKRREVVLEKFLRHIDQGLGEVLKAYKLPVHIIATPKVAGLFKKISRRPESISSYRHGNYMDAAPAELSRILPEEGLLPADPAKELQEELETAANEKKLACGFAEVSAAALHKNARLLLLEDDFSLPAQPGKAENVAATDDEGAELTIDEVIEKVISCGGDIRFVAHDALKEFGHIALVQYYHE